MEIAQELVDQQVRVQEFDFNSSSFGNEMELAAVLDGLRHEYPVVNLMQVVPPLAFAIRDVLLTIAASTCITKRTARPFVGFWTLAISAQ